MSTENSSPCPLSPGPPSPASEQRIIHWTAGLVFATLGIFLLAGLFGAAPTGVARTKNLVYRCTEIGGGWLVWQTIRGGRPWYWAMGGCLVLAAYGFVPTLQPQEASFSRVYAVYGGVFLVLSYLWGWAIDGDKPDTGDFAGAAVALTGVAMCWFWPRG